MIMVSNPNRKIYSIFSVITSKSIVAGKICTIVKSGTTNNDF